MLSLLRYLYGCFNAGIKGKTIFHNSISNLSSAVKLCWFCVKMNNQLFLAVIVVASVLLTVSGTKTKSKANSDHGYCNLLNDQTDEYFELVFEYKNMVEDLEAMRDRFLSVSRVVNSEEAIKIYYHSNSIRFQMNRAAYEIVRGAIAILMILIMYILLFIQVCTYSEVISVKHYEDSHLWIQDNVCRNLSKAITMYRLNETGLLNSIYFITFHYKNDLLAERSCNRTYSQLKKQINEMKCTSTDEHTQSGYNKPLLV